MGEDVVEGADPIGHPEFDGVGGHDDAALTEAAAHGGLTDAAAARDGFDEQIVIAIEEPLLREARVGA